VIILFESFGRSWEVTKLSFGVIWKDKELLWYPVLSVIFSGLLLLLLVFPTIFALIFSHASGKAVIITGVNFLLMFIAYLGIAFVSTFFNVCVVYTAKKRFEGGNATFFESLGFALKKVHKIFLWSLLAATVGIILSMIDGAANKSKGLVKLALQIFRSVLGAAWSILTLFVIQGIVYYDLGPINAIKKSFEALKKTWGENIILYIGVNVVQWVVNTISIVVFVVLLFIIWPLGWVAIIILASIFVAYIVLVTLIFHVLVEIYKTALFVYADTGKIPEGYDKQTMQQAFKQETKE